MQKIDYIHVTADPADHLRNAFINVYKEAFGGHPYFETYTDEQVLNDTWSPHFAKGIIVLALDGENVVGLGCAKPVSEAPPEDQSFLKACRENGWLTVHTDTMWYMSELAVLTNYRRKGIGYRLVCERLKRILALGGDHYSFRTASQGSNSAQLYTNIGAVKLPGVVDVSGTDQVKINDSQSFQRIFFYGECASTIRTIEAMT